MLAWATCNEPLLSCSFKVSVLIWEIERLFFGRTYIIPLQIYYANKNEKGEEKRNNVWGEEKRNRKKKDQKQEKRGMKAKRIVKVDGLPSLSEETSWQDPCQGSYYHRAPHPILITLILPLPWFLQFYFFLSLSVATTSAAFTLLLFTFGLHSSILPHNYSQTSETKN